MSRQIVLDTETTGLSAEGGDRIILAIRSALEVDGDLLSASEREAIDKDILGLQQVATGEDAAAIEASIKALAARTEAFAAQRMNRGIRQALAGKNLQDI